MLDFSPRKCSSVISSLFIVFLYRINWHKVAKHLTIFFSIESAENCWANAKSRLSIELMYRNFRAIFLFLFIFVAQLLSNRQKMAIQCETIDSERQLLFAEKSTFCRAIVSSFCVIYYSKDIVRSCFDLAHSFSRCFSSL